MSLYIPRTWGGSAIRRLVSHSIAMVSNISGCKPHLKLSMEEVRASTLDQYAGGTAPNSGIEWK